MEQGQLRRVYLCEVLFALFTMAGSVLFHALYALSAESAWLAPFVPINESVFEHIKILLFPFLLFSVMEAFFIKVKLKRYIAAKAMAALLIPLVMVTLFYVYSGIIGHSIVAVDIVCAFSNIAFAYFVSCKNILSRSNPSNQLWWALPLCLILVALVILATYYPPNLPLFFDEAKQIYGFK